MLDHVFTDAIEAVRVALETAMLERQAFEERFQTDILLGDLSWVTSYSLPGEGSPPRVQAELTLDWPTWAQTAYRTWYVEGELGDGPRIEIEIVFRLQRLAAAPDPRLIVSGLPTSPPRVGSEVLEGFGPTIEATYGYDLSLESHAAEVTYSGSYELDEASLEDGSTLHKDFGAMGGWIASALVRFGDLPLPYLTADDGI